MFYRLRNLTSALAILLSCAFSAQDLVTNPSFNLDGAAPTGYSQLEKTSGWMNGNGGTVDIYAEGAPKCGTHMGVPENVQGTQAAFDGNSYAGIIAYRDDQVNSYWPDILEEQTIGSKEGYGKYSEYITTELAKPLEAGKAYRVTYQVSLADKSGRAVGNFGAYVSTEAPGQASNAFMDVKPSFVNSQVMENKEGWTAVTGTFTAKGGEKYLTIGIFDAKKMEVKDVIGPDMNDNRQAYYYVDGMNILPAEGVDFNMILSGENVVLTKLYFDTGKSTIKSESYPQLDKFADWLKGHSDIGVSIDGHTDKSGSDELNLKLSKDRAEAVKNYLVSKGVDGSKLFTRGFGDTQPKDTSKLENNPKNRRVEISLRK